MQTIEHTEAAELTAEEVAALIADAPTESPAAFVPDTPERVDWVLGKIAAARAEAALIRENMELMARAKDREAEALMWKFAGPLQTWLRAETEGGKKKSVRLPHGVLGYRTKSAGINITDENLVIEWARVNCPVAIIERLTKKWVQDRILETGEVVDGAQIVPAEEVFYIK